MTAGSVSPYLPRPEDISRPKPGYFFNVFWMVHSYVNLVLNIPTPIASKGIVKLFSYRTGVITPDTSTIEKIYIRLMEQNQVKLKDSLTEFGNGLISYNLITLYRLLSNTIISDIQKGFGDDKCLTHDTMRTINQFCVFHRANRSWRDKREDNIKSVVETCRYNAIYAKPGISSLTEIIVLIDTINEILKKPILEEADELVRRKYLLDITRIVFYVGCRYYHINVLRFADLKLARPYTRDLQINDFTLAALPFDPTMIFSCADDDGTMSRYGVEYVQSLNAVLSELGGIEAIVNFPQ